MRKEIDLDHEHPGVLADKIVFYISDRMRADAINIYSSFLLNNESLRLRQLYLHQPAWGASIGISNLIALLNHAQMAAILDEHAALERCKEWMSMTAESLAERRSHELTEALLSGVNYLEDREFLRFLSRQRTDYDELPDDNGPYPIELFPWHYYAPESCLLGETASPDRELDKETEDLVISLALGRWG